MRFTDINKSYNELFPQTPKTKPVKVIETPVGDIVEEEHEETPVVIEDTEERESNGSTGTSQPDNE